MWKHLDAKNRSCISCIPVHRSLIHSFGELISIGTFMASISPAQEMYVFQNIIKYNSSNSRLLWRIPALWVLNPSRVRTWRPFPAALMDTFYGPFSRRHLWLELMTLVTRVLGRYDDRYRRPGKEGNAIVSLFSFYTLHETLFLTDYVCLM